MATYDLIVIGSGLAGVMTALQVSEDTRVLMLSKGDFRKTNSYLAQGGIAAAIGPKDSPEAHFKDTMACGHGKCEPRAVRVMTQGAFDAIKTLEAYGAVFDQDHDGYLLALEGAHSVPRILRVGDYTGKALMEALYPRLAHRAHFKHLEGASVSKLLTHQGACYGVEVFLGGKVRPFFAPHVVLATGGAGHLFEHTTNAEGVDGSGLALALEAGAHLKRPGHFQFHPTGFFQKGLEKRHFLISEAVRGEGGLLKDLHGERFMQKKHPLKELAPRDVVSKAIMATLKDQETPHVFLDASHLDGAFLKQRFPTIHAHLLDEGIDFTKVPIPVKPCMHYYMGGIETDTEGRTHIEGLYAIGECAHTGVHGENRLASNSLLEIAVFSKRLAKYISQNQRELKCPKAHRAQEMVPLYDMDEAHLKSVSEGHFGLMPGEAPPLKAQTGWGEITEQRLTIHLQVKLLNQLIKERLENGMA